MKKLYMLSQEGIDVNTLENENISEHDVVRVIDYVLKRQFDEQMGSDNECLSNRFVQVSDKQLKRLHRKAPKSLRLLVKAGILDRTYYDVEKGKAFSYRFHPDFFGKVKPFVLSKDDVHGHTFNSLLSKMSGLKMTVKDDVDYMRQLAEYVMDVEIGDDALDMAISENNKHVRTLVNIRNRKWHFISDSVDGRVYTNVTQLPKKYRKYISLSGIDDLSFLDLSSSNYYFFCALLVEYITTSQLPTTTPTQSAFTFNSSSPSVLSYYMTNAKAEDTTKEFITHTLNGTLYEHLMPILQSHYKTTVDRDKTKTLSQVILNKSTEELTSDTYQYAPDENYSVTVDNSRMKGFYLDLKERYPQVIGTMERMKEELSTTLGVRLMKMESDIMIHKISRHIIEHSDIPFLTVHDCFIFPTDFQDWFVDTVRNSFVDILGQSPSLHVEPLN